MGLHGVGGKGRGAMGRQGKGQGKESGHGYVGSLVFPGKGLEWWGGVVLPAVPLTRSRRGPATGRCGDTHR